MLGLCAWFGLTVTRGELSVGANRLLIMDHEPEVRGFVGGVGRDLGFEVTDTSVQTSLLAR